jgi:hypothetical protein
MLYKGYFTYAFKLSGKLLLSTIVVLHFHFCQAQKKTDNLEAAINYHYGYVVPEYSNLTYLVNKPVQSVSLNVFKKTTGKTDWEQIYKFPEYGFTLLYTTLGNKAVNGDEFALYPYFSYTIASGERFALSNRVGFGLGYVTRKYNADDNYLNVAVGSHLNIHFNLGLSGSYALTEKIKIQAGLAFDHLSNANLSEPNLGLNWTTTHLGVAYLLGQKTNIVKRELEPHAKKFYVETIVSVGAKHPRSLNSEIYFASSFTTEARWEVSRIARLGIGADLFFDTGTETEMLAAGRNDFENIDQFKTGIHLSQELVYNRFSIMLQEGVYVFLTDKGNKRIMYNRGVVRFKTSKRSFVQLALKSHLHILDYPELGLGWRWK